LHARGQYSEAEGNVAVDDDFLLARFRRRNLELDIEIRLGPLVACFQEPQIWVDDTFALLCEHEGHLLARQVQVQTVDAA
jgi:hypothetical protein